MAAIAAGVDQSDLHPPLPQGQWRAGPASLGVVPSRTTRSPAGLPGVLLPRALRRITLTSSVSSAGFGMKRSQWSAAGFTYTAPDAFTPVVVDVERHHVGVPGSVGNALYRESCPVDGDAGAGEGLLVLTDNAESQFAPTTGKGEYRFGKLQIRGPATSPRRCLGGIDLHYEVGGTHSGATPRRAVRPSARPQCPALPRRWRPARVENRGNVGDGRFRLHPSP